LLLGTELPFDPGWHVVEGDLYDISARVKEYDEDVALVRDADTGHLGLARLNRLIPNAPDGAFLLAVQCIDPINGGPLAGEPDARVTLYQRIADKHRTSESPRVWARRRRDALAAERAAHRIANADWNDSMAHEFVWRRRAELGRQPSIPVTKEIH